MCHILKFISGLLPEKNHKDISMERYHHFLNKTITLDGNDRSTNKGVTKILKQCNMLGTALPLITLICVCCLATASRIFNFPMDVDPNALPILADSSHISLEGYLHNVSDQS